MPHLAAPAPLDEEHLKHLTLPFVAVISPRGDGWSRDDVDALLQALRSAVLCVCSRACIAGAGTRARVPPVRARPGARASAAVLPLSRAPPWIHSHAVRWTGQDGSPAALQCALQTVGRGTTRRSRAARDVEQQMKSRPTLRI